MLWNPYVTQIDSPGYLWSNPKKHARRRWFFTKNAKEKADFICWLVRPASSDKWKAPLVPLRRHHFAPFAQVTSAGQQACQGLPYEFRPALQCFLQGQPSPEENIASLCLHWAALYAAGEDLLLSCPVLLEEKKRLIQGSYSFKFSKFHDFPWVKEWMNEYNWWITLFTQGDTLQLRTDKLVTRHDFFHDLFLVFHDLRFTYSCHLRKFSPLYLF